MEPDLMLIEQVNGREYRAPRSEVCRLGYRPMHPYTPPHVRRHYRAITWKLVSSWAAPATVKPVRVVL